MKDLLLRRCCRTLLQRPSSFSASIQHRIHCRSCSAIASSSRSNARLANFGTPYPQHCSLSTTTTTTITLPYSPPLRRRRIKYKQYNEAKLQESAAPSSSLQEAFRYSGENLDQYVEKANLSPWTPVPDSVARKIFDSAQPGPDDIHVELGSGDGRVNFHAIEYGAGKSVGIDVDEDIVQVGIDRLQRIHPQPNLEFLVSDLMDPTSIAWTEHVPNATILTMYFAKDGLEKIRPLLEQALRGKRCKIYTCGYAMPGWESQMVETVLDIPIHFYDWGNADVHMLVPESFVDELPPGMAPPDTMDQYLRNKNKGGESSNYQPDPLPGFHPDDLKDYAWDDFESSSEEAIEKK